MTRRKRSTRSKKAGREEATALTQNTFPAGLQPFALAVRVLFVVFEIVANFKATAITAKVRLNWFFAVRAKENLLIWLLSPGPVQ
jgi:hypothetical protein